MAKWLILLGVLAIGIFAYRRWQKRAQEGWIEKFPFASVLDQRLLARHPQLTPEQRGQVFEGLRDYFRLCHRAGRRMVAMPSQVVDDAWHEFILFTRQYDRFCRRAYGRFLHHTPAEAMSSPTQASEGIRRAWRLACQQEAINPKQPERLPRLFAIDAGLAIAGGFFYQLDCLAAKGGAVAQGFCASHIGCGGGCSGDAGGASNDGSSSDGGDGGGCGGGCGGGD